jgi:hypothetical protein
MKSARQRGFTPVSRPRRIQHEWLREFVLCSACTGDSFAARPRAVWDRNPDGCDRSPTASIERCHYVLLNPLLHSDRPAPRRPRRAGRLAPVCRGSRSEAWTSFEGAGSLSAGSRVAAPQLRHRLLRLRLLTPQCGAPPARRAVASPRRASGSQGRCPGFARGPAARFPMSGSVGVRAGGRWPSADPAARTKRPAPPREAPRACRAAVRAP